MRRSTDWPELRAEYLARGYDLATEGMFRPPDHPPEADAWEDWDRLKPFLQPSTEEGDWQVVRPHLEAIERAIRKRADFGVESRSIRHFEGMEAAKFAIGGLVAGAQDAGAPAEALHCLHLASRISQQLSTGNTLLNVLLGVSSSRRIFEAVGFLMERGVSPEANRSLREIVSGLVLPPWRTVALAELHYSLGWIDRACAGGESMENDLGLVTDDRQYDGIRKVAALLARPDAQERGLRDRARLKIGALYAKALLDPETTDDLLCLDKIAPTLEPSAWGRYSFDLLARAMAATPSGAWPALPRVYRSLIGYRRMILFVSLVRDLPIGTPFAEVLRLRNDLGEEGWDPFLRNPVRVVDQGAQWAFFANAVKEIATVRIPRL